MVPSMIICLTPALPSGNFIGFIQECVLSEDEEPCDVPEKFIENAGKNAWELRP